MLVRRLARPMLASMFIVGGIDTLRRPAPKVQAAEALGLQENTEQVVKGNAAAQVVGRPRLRHQPAAAAVAPWSSPARWSRRPPPVTASGSTPTRPSGPTRPSTS